jgi:hypothetical protein
LKSVAESSSFSRITLIPNGARDCSNADTDFLSASSVVPHLGQVSPSDINRFHLIFRVPADSFSIPLGGIHSQFSLFLSESYTLVTTVA